MPLGTIHIWGDSIGRGVKYDAERGRYGISRERASQRLQDELGLSVVNHCVMGATSLSGLTAFRASPPDEGAIAVMEYGGNDCDLNWALACEAPESALTAKVELNDFERALRSLVLLARERGMKPVLVTPPPLCAPRYFAFATRGLNRARALKAIGDINHIYRWQERYAVRIYALSRELGCMLFDARDAILARPDYMSLMSRDGIHPSDAGHRVLAEAAVSMARMAMV